MWAPIYTLRRRGSVHGVSATAMDGSGASGRDPESLAREHHKRLSFQVLWRGARSAEVLGAVAAALEPRRHRRVDGRAPRPARWLATTAIYERVVLCSFRIRWFGNRYAVPLYRCSGCGFVTTASLGNALRAHAVGSPDCASELELAADFSKAPEDASRLGRARPRNRSVSAETPADPPAPQPGA